MEIELKYLLEDHFAKNKLFKDKQIEKLKDPSSEETLHMKAIYLDTEDGSLTKANIAFRIRLENSRIFATVKWRGAAQDGLHSRGEINIPVDEGFIKNPRIDIFKDTEIYAEMVAIVKDQKLTKLIEMEFCRHQVKVDTGNSISMLSLDEGEILTKNGNVPIAEVELELYSGDLEDMIALGEKLAEKYNMTSCNVSKLERGLNKLRVV